MVSPLVFHPPEPSPPPAAAPASPQALASLSLPHPRVVRLRGLAPPGSPLLTCLVSEDEVARCSPGLPQSEAFEHPSPPKRRTFEPEGSEDVGIRDRGVVAKNPAAPREGSHRPTARSDRRSATTYHPLHRTKHDDAVSRDAACQAIPEGLGRRCARVAEDTNLATPPG